MFHQISIDSDQVSHYPREMVIRIDYIQLGKARIIRPYEFMRHSRGVTFCSIRRWVWTKPQGRGDCWRGCSGYTCKSGQAPAPPQRSRLPAMCTTVQMLLSPRTRYSASRSEWVIRRYVKVCSIWTKVQTMVRSLTDTGGIKRHMPRLPNNNSNTGSCLISIY
jgi:hypothetical protein